jgi:hypothetical protein
MKQINKHTPTKTQRGIQKKVKRSIKRSTKQAGKLTQEYIWSAWHGN